jgi:hypothetical protein
MVAGYFKKHSLPSPVFKTQGSFVLKTIINPLSHEYDIDDGIYLKGLGNDISDWPAPRAMLKKVYTAVKNGFPRYTQVRRACVEVKKPGQYRIHLPVFAFHDTKPFVADTGPEGWHKSDTIELDWWLKEQFKKHGPQLKRLVRYIKAWSDVQRKRYHLPSNLILTLYMVTEYPPDNRDDLAFANTVKNIARRIKRSYKLINPMEPGENMTRRLTPRQKRDGIAAMSKLSQAAEKALNTDNTGFRMIIWRKQFGERFR